MAASGAVDRSALHIYVQRQPAAAAAATDGGVCGSSTAAAAARAAKQAETAVRTRQGSFATLADITAAAPAAVPAAAGAAVAAETLLGAAQSGGAGVHRPYEYKQEQTWTKSDDTVVYSKVNMSNSLVHRDLQPLTLGPLPKLALCI